MANDIAILQRLAAEYTEIAALPIQQERRKLWRAHNSKRTFIQPVLLRFGYWNAWASAYFADERMACCDPFWRAWERTMRIALFHYACGDDVVTEPWLTMHAHLYQPPGGVWGVPNNHILPDTPNGAWQFAPALKRWEDTARLVAAPHRIDEEATHREYDRVQGAIGHLVTINIDRSPLLTFWDADFSYPLAQLRGLNQMMLDMADSPIDLHRLLAFMQRGVLDNQAAAEAAGDYGLANSYNQQMPYCDELPAPQANVQGQKRNHLWYFCAAQECTLISPKMFDEFIVHYQQPIVEHYGLLAYGCCEDLTNKIDVLRQLRNLRVIAVTPRADVARCAEQIGTDYVISWRPNPTDMVCGDFGQAKVQRILSSELAKLRGCYAHILLKDVEDIGGDVTRLARWVNWAREAAANA
jgi:hypothetical protein